MNNHKLYGHWFNSLTLYFLYVITIHNIILIRFKSKNQSKTGIVFFHSLFFIHGSCMKQHLSFALIRKSHALYCKTFAFSRENYGFIRESFALSRQGYGLIRESFPFICQSFAFVRDEFLPKKMGFRSEKT